MTHSNPGASAGVNVDNYFMPKRSILRADGASLYDVYMSKRGDTWGKIIKAQYLEELGK